MPCCRWCTAQRARASPALMTRLLYLIHCCCLLSHWFFSQLLDVPARPLHAGLQQRQRLKHLDKFSESDAGVLVATDVAARGLDIPDVRAVRALLPSCQRFFF